jgi:hypothetical protein
MFISGQAIQSECKWNLDNRYPIRKWSLFTQVHAGDKVFMKHSDIPWFIEHARQLHVKVDVVIHNSDESFTTDDLNRITPFTRNVYAVNSVTPYARILPLGFRDHQYVSHHIMKSVADEPELERSITCLVNFLISTNVPARQRAYNYFKDKPFCTIQDYVSYDLQKSLTHRLPETMEKRLQFYRTLKHTKFAVCPPGTGIDTHRVYECILFGVIPIVLTSPLDSLYQSLPIWIVNDWNEVTEDALKKCTIQPNPSSVKEFRIEW